MDLLLQNPFTFFLANATMISVILAIIVQYVVKPARWVESINKDLEMLKGFAKEFPKDTDKKFDKVYEKFDNVHEDIKKILTRGSTDDRS